ncbi:MAG: hypothetical protein K0Q49_1160 [Haloplasmataceae bacterium]|jgi:uncharacterized protein YaiI (UPF0178 family)|nr:hypothetical protein [Haloplasmataceae bacterium]
MIRLFKILVDADACPVKQIILKIAKLYNIEVYMLFDTSHIYEDGYSKTIYIDKGRDSVDFALVNLININDIVVTQDYGVACISLSRGANVLNQNGLIYTSNNIDLLLHQRFVSAKIRQSGMKTKGPKKRNVDQDYKFELEFFNLIKKLLLNY